ncbi:MAG: porin family protein [Gammaproteobacteria bacterium]|nr:porin family protein [Gammaproteobacteria bacterium]
MNIFKTNLRLKIYFILLLLVNSNIISVQASETSEDWSYFVGGYLTATAIDAKTTSFAPVGDQELEIDASFSELLDNLDYGASGIFIARRGAYSFNLDLVFIGLDIENALPLPGSKADINVDIREHEFYVGYAAFDDYPELEVITGIRYVDQEVTVKIKTPVPNLPTLNIGDNWVDPFVGLRYMGPISKKWNWHLRGDIGGFNVGSEFSWRVDAGATYRFNQHWEAAFFYKILDIDYETGTSGTPSIYKWDGRESGLTFGIGYHF